MGLLYFGVPWLAVAFGDTHRNYTSRRYLRFSMTRPQKSKTARLAPCRSPKSNLEISALLLLPPASLRGHFRHLRGHGLVHFEIRHLQFPEQIHQHTVFFRCQIPFRLLAQRVQHVD